MREWKKATGLPQGLTGTDSGKSKGAVGSSGVCKDQRCVSVCVSSVHMCMWMSVLSFSKTSKDSRLRKKIGIHKTKLAPQQGIYVSLLYWTKDLTIITGGQEGGQNSSKGTMALWVCTDAYAHTHTHTERMHA